MRVDERPNARVRRFNSPLSTLSLSLTCSTVDNSFIVAHGDKIVYSARHRIWSEALLSRCLTLLQKICSRPCKQQAHLKASANQWGRIFTSHEYALFLDVAYFENNGRFPCCRGRKPLEIALWIYLDSRQGEFVFEPWGLWLLRGNACQWTQAWGV